MRRKVFHTRLSALYTIPFLTGLVLGLILISLFLTAAVLGFLGYYRVTERILPGVHIAGNKIGHMTMTEAAIEIQRTWNQENKILITDGIHPKYVLPESIGLRVDPIATANKAYNLGQGEDVISSLGTIIKANFFNANENLVVNFDREIAHNGLEMLAAEMSVPPVDATIQLRGAELVPISGHYGYTINIEDTIAMIEFNPSAVMLEGTLQVKLKPVLPRINDVTEAIVQGQRLLDSPVDIQAYDPVTDETISLQVPREILASWLIVETAEFGPVVNLDPGAIIPYLDQSGTNLGSDRIINGGTVANQVADAILEGKKFTLLVNHKETSYEIQPGDTLLKIGWNLGIPFWMILEANPGMNPDALTAGQIIKIPSRDDLLPYPVVPNKRIEISISKQRLWVYENGELISKNVISTGMDRSPTQPGVFQVQTHDLNAYASVWDLTMPHFIGIYEAWPGFMNGIHGLPTLSSGRQLWGNVLGRPASYGCIIMDLDAAEWLYNWAEQGVVVEIQP